MVLEVVVINKAMNILSNQPIKSTITLANQMWSQSKCSCFVLLVKMEVKDKDNVTFFC
jgi:hypothetical protein